MSQFLIKSISFLLLLQISSLTALSIQSGIRGGVSVGLQGLDTDGNEIINNDGEFPYMAAIDENDQHVCGGVIIQGDAIVTAAHCVHGLDPSIFKIRAGTLYLWPGSDDTTQTIEVAEIKSHPRFRPSDNANDIAIMWLKGNFTFNKYVNKVNMSKLIGSDFVGETFTTIGWGGDGKYARSSSLKKADITVITLESCRKIHSAYSIPDSVFCAIDNDHLQTTCTGDSGGPIIRHYPEKSEKDVLVGIKSGGFCKTDLPTLFTDVGQMYKWVHVQIKKHALTDF